MFQLGEIRKAEEIGYKSRAVKFIWAACETCGKERWVPLEKGKPKRRRCYPCAIADPELRKKRSEAIRGEKHPHWKNGRIADSDGYILIRLDKDDFFYPMCNKKGYVPEHRLVVAKALGRNLHPWEVVHHKGIRRTGIENRSDNLEDNLQLVSDLGHKQLTLLENKIDNQTSLIKELQREIKLLQWHIKELNANQNSLLQNRQPAMYLG